MSVYAGASDGAYTFKAYMRVQQDAVQRATANLMPNDSASFLKETAKIMYATQNMTFANDTLGQILKNISSLQP